VASAQNGNLTERERQVLALRATGKTVPELAAVLGVTERTANFHLGNIYAKLGLEQLAPGERQLRLADYARRVGAEAQPGGHPTRKESTTPMTSTASASPTPAPHPASAEPRHPVITFKVTRLPDGRVRAENRVWHSYRDKLSDSVVEGEYSGVLTGKDKDMAPGPRLEQRLRDHVARDFELLPRPLTVRVVYEGEGLEPVGPGEKTFVVTDRIKDE
jgi:hypothetical protein